MHGRHSQSISELLEFVRGTWKHLATPFEWRVATVTKLHSVGQRGRLVSQPNIPHTQNPKYNKHHQYTTFRFLSLIHHHTWGQWRRRSAVSWP
ncbi:hypothetical protein L2E82_14308 [Cichorium intybus]|uniref:Uncharacterized protein n=1 Tax=Cichorium intybus TaxID=13427 RepID=A0ACB9F017_CICIN|nr:hypothetical protein L2E82_14308 [Cichorium intybus]